MKNGATHENGNNEGWKSISMQKLDISIQCLPSYKLYYYRIYSSGTLWVVRSFEKLEQLRKWIEYKVKSRLLCFSLSIESCMKKIIDLENWCDYWFRWNECYFCSQSVKVAIAIDIRNNYKQSSEWNDISALFSIPEEQLFPPDECRSIKMDQPKPINAIGKVRLLLWKNYLLQKRHYIQTLLDIFLPGLIFVFCAFLNAQRRTIFTVQRTYSSMGIDSLQPLLWVL